MKRYQYILLSILLFTTAISCKKSEFVNQNVDPNTLYSVAPKEQFFAAAVASENDFEYYYDVYRSLNLWMQYATISSGNGTGLTNPGAHFNYRYASVFYTSVGNDLSDIPVLVSKMPEAEQVKYVHLQAMADIFKAYYAFYVSDINGSIPYSQAFQGRYGGILEPAYDRQQNLFDTLDLQIKNAVHNLETEQSIAQQLPGSKDPFFGANTSIHPDEVMSWIKAGNALRLKIALRLMKQDPSKLQSIASEVLSDPNQMSGNDDGWVLMVGPAYANATGNFNPNGFAAAKPTLDFMVAKQDPRLSIFYTKNKSGQYLGSYPSPDEVAPHAGLYAKPDTFSTIQPRLFAPNYAYASGADAGVAGSGDGFFPVLTYAEYCFIRADLAARSIAGTDAEGWYNKGVTASIEFYNDRAASTKIRDYVAVTPTAISDYLAMPDIAYNPSKATEQIATQAFLEFFRQPSEAWAWWKRTGFPNTSSILPWDELKQNGNVLVLPRRASLFLKLPTDPNYANQKAAFDEMATDPGFGAPDDPTGRVWWDKN